MSKKNLFVVEASNYTNSRMYPMVSLSLVNTGRSGCHEFNLAAFAIAENSTREVDCFFNFGELEELANQLNRVIEAEVAERLARGRKTWLAEHPGETIPPWEKGAVHETHQP